MRELRFPSATAIETLPWWLRALLGFIAGSVAAATAHWIVPLRSFPLMVAFPVVVLSCWFMGMWGGVFCGITEAILVDRFFTRADLRLSLGSAPQGIRLAVFLAISMCLGYSIRRLARQRSQLTNRELQQRLTLAHAERQLAEERVRASEALRDRDALLQIALQANGMGLWVLNLEKDTAFWSEEVFAITGWEKGRIEARADAWLEGIYAEDGNRVRAAFARAREIGADFREEYRVVWPDGTMHWLESRGTCHLDGDGRVTRLLGVVADVTHRKQAEEAMLRAEKLAAVGRLAASVAHEINNPLEAVANLLYLISLAETTEAASAWASQALDELMRVSLITQQTLQFHRQTGTKKAVLLSELIDAGLVFFRSRLLAAKIATEVRVKRESAVACMSGEMQQIFANLISNAIEAMPEGGRLTFGLRRSRDWRNWCAEGMRVTICDTGVGMPRETERRIFEPFFTTKTETGTGLGMWVVSQLVERHHGHIRVWSTQRAGACGTAFSLFIPFAAVPLAEKAVEAVAVESKA